jgi:GNAT superfamily N-acetyltransferase
VSLPRADVAAAATVLARAFRDYPETVHLLGTARRRDVVLPRFLATDVRDADAHGGARLARDGSTGAVTGAALWLPPGAYPIALGRQARQLLELVPTLPWTAPILPELLRSQRSMRPGHPHEPHWYLRVLGVDPTRQGEGIGAGLVRPVLDEADREGVGAYLTTAVEANLAWYARFGFEVLESLHPTPTWPLTWRMWRRPAPAG